MNITIKFKKPNDLIDYEQILLDISDLILLNQDSGGVIFKVTERKIEGESK